MVAVRRLTDADPATRHLLWEWGYALGNARRARGLSPADVARLADLGERLTESMVFQAEAGLGELDDLLAITEALELGVVIELVPAEELRAAWGAGTADRMRRRRAAQALEAPTAGGDLE